MKILILTGPDDAHAALVKVALENEGHHARLFFPADQPSKQRNSIYIDCQDYHWKSSHQSETIIDNDYDVVWWRRPRKPFLEHHSIHPEDWEFVRTENILFYESFTNNIAPNAWWVNPKFAAKRANSKLLQLKCAAENELIIPTTLCSNDPQDIRYFILKHEEEGVIYKPLSTKYWENSHQIKMAYTSKISFLDLPHNHILQLTPGIFQKQIKKKYELRIICFGDYVVAVKLNSQDHQEGKIDWRAIPEGQLKIEPYIIPIQLERRILQFMNALGLVFGSLDFIVTIDNEYVFLEVNEQGQFLWIEEYNPEIKLLDMFVNFIIKGSSHFHWDFKKSAHTIEKYHPEIINLMEHNLKSHVSLNCSSSPL